MKLLQRRIQQAARDSRVQQLIVERDYAQSYVLFGIANQAALRETLVFKGGTALKKIHFKTYRFSEDLDFSAIDGPKGTVLERAIRAAIDTAQSTARAFAPVTMVVERYEERAPHPGGQETFIVRIQFPWQQQPLVPVKIEISHDEPVLLPAPLMPVVHGYGETFEAMIRTYRLEEVCAEKLRSTRQTQAKRAARALGSPAWARLL